MNEWSDQEHSDTRSSDDSDFTDKRDHEKYFDIPGV